MLKVKQSKQKGRKESKSKLKSLNKGHSFLSKLEISTC